MKSSWIMLLTVIVSEIHTVIGKGDEYCQTKDCLCCASAPDGTRDLDEICPTANNRWCKYSCMNGYWGHRCYNNCSRCAHNACDNVLGTCQYGCTHDGWTGDRCDVCADGFYGRNCDKTCPLNCKRYECDKLLGTCQYGCTHDGWTGDKCDVCADGFYGRKCDKTCPLNCKLYECDKTDGVCVYGCRVNGSGGDPWLFDDVGNMYGAKCDNPCPKNCHGGLCYWRTGKCSYGCQGNFTGSACEECGNGYHGDACNKTCPDNCVNNICHKDGGKCGDCVTGFHGERCDLDCAPCCINATCIKETGICTYGCVEEDTEKCLHNEVDGNGNIGIILGGVIGGLCVVITFLVGYIIYLRCRGREPKANQEPEPNNELEEQHNYEGLVGRTRNERTIYSDLQADEVYINI